MICRSSLPAWVSEVYYSLALGIPAKRSASKPSKKSTKNGLLGWLRWGPARLVAYEGRELWRGLLRSLQKADCVRSPAFLDREGVLLLNPTSAAVLLSELVSSAQKSTWRVSILANSKFETKKRPTSALSHLSTQHPPETTTQSRCTRTVKPSSQSIYPGQN